MTEPLTRMSTRRKNRGSGVRFVQLAGNKKFQPGVGDVLYYAESKLGMR